MLRLQAEEARLKILTRRRKLERSEREREGGSAGGVEGPTGAKHISEVALCHNYTDSLGFNPSGVCSANLIFSFQAAGRGFTCWK